MTLLLRDTCLIQKKKMPHDVCPAGSSSVRPAKDLNLKVGVSSVPVQKRMCEFLPKAEVKLMFINDTAPSCGQVELKTLCFPDKISKPHITENRMHGALRQLRRFTLMNICPNYTISYGVEAGTNQTHCKCQSFLYITVQ